MIKPIVSTAAALLLSLSFSLPSFAAEKGESKTDTIKTKVESIIGMPVTSVVDSPVDGLHQVMTQRGIFYVSSDAQFFIHGTVYNMDKGMLNETEAVVSKVRETAVKEFESSMIVFKAAEEKHVVNIFTDISCGYCRKLHSEMKDYNDAGITVRYLAFPRGGIGSQSYKDMVSVWCAEDQQKAMTEAKERKPITAKVCDVPVAEQYEVGGRLGVTGTPAIILENGTMVPGYRPAKDLLSVLEQSKAG